MNEKSLAVQYGIFKVICIVYFVTVFFFFLTVLVFKMGERNEGGGNCKIYIDLIHYLDPI